MAFNQIFSREFDPFLYSPFLGEVMSQLGTRAKLCVGKNRLDSSIQAQCAGDFMRQKWRSYDLSDTFSGSSNSDDC